MSIDVTTEVPEPSDDDLAAVVYDVGGDAQNDFERALVLNGVYWARAHLSHSATSTDAATVKREKLRLLERGEKGRKA